MWGDVATYRSHHPALMVTPYLHDISRLLGGARSGQTARCGDGSAGDYDARVRVAVGPRLERFTKKIDGGSRGLVEAVEQQQTRAGEPAGQPGPRSRCRSVEDRGDKCGVKRPSVSECSRDMGQPDPYG